MRKNYGRQGFQLPSLLEVVKMQNQARKKPRFVFPFKQQYGKPNKMLVERAMQKSYDFHKQQHAKAGTEFVLDTHILGHDLMTTQYLTKAEVDFGLLNLEAYWDYRQELEKPKEAVDAAVSSDSNND